MKDRPPLRLATLGTSPPEGGEEGHSGAAAAAFPRLLQGERWSAKQTGEGEAKKKPERRRSGATKRARSLRQAGNKAEALLWLELKARRLGGYHFVRQFPIGPYFADFACRSKRLVVEIDGSHHPDNPYDRTRDEFMRQAGWSVIRFWNTDILKHRTSICETLLAALDGRLAENVIAPDLRFVFAPPAQPLQISSPSDPTP
jgi:very-short-patch-repair endonuclease